MTIEMEGNMQTKVCAKCYGTGEFIGRNGWKGKCFSCDGTGTSRSAREVRIPKEDIDRLFTRFDNAVMNGAEKPSLRVEGFLMKHRYKNGNAVVYVLNQMGTYIGTVVPTIDDDKCFDDGVFKPRFEATDDMINTFLERLGQLDQEVIRYGRITGKCSCCGRTLTRHESIEAGIGPICAGNYGGF